MVSYKSLVSVAM